MSFRFQIKDPFSFILILLVVMFGSCNLVKGIFDAGVGVGIFICVAIVALIIFFISKAGKS